LSGLFDVRGMELAGGGPVETLPEHLSRQGSQGDVIGAHAFMDVR
jgi:hypothetical protein